MNRLLLSLFGAVCLSSVASAHPTNAVQRLTLNPMTVLRIPVARDRLTTIRFPSALSDLQAALVVTEPHPEALFLVTFRTGDAFFSVRALAAGTNTSLNAVWKNQTYVLELVESPTPWLSVICDAPPEPVTHPAHKAVTPARLLGLLDTAKAYGLLHQQYPERVAGVEVVRPDTVRDYGDYTIRTEEIFRFDAEDTLVFRIGVSNKTHALIRYLPESLMVRVYSTSFDEAMQDSIVGARQRQRIFYQSIAEATGLLPAAAQVPIYFAVTGSADGSRNLLSPRNDFMVMLVRLDAPNSPASPLTASSADPSMTLPVTAALATQPSPSAAVAVSPVPTNAPCYKWVPAHMNSKDCPVWQPTLAAAPLSPATAPSAPLLVGAPPSDPNDFGPNDFDLTVESITNGAAAEANRVTAVNGYSLPRRAPGAVPLPVIAPAAEPNDYCYKLLPNTNGASAEANSYAALNGYILVRVPQRPAAPPSPSASPSLPVQFPPPPAPVSAAPSN
jgi:hypothetical protein